jgi:hypothetical protein
VTADQCVDCLYLAWNRLEFTRESFTALVANTEWRFVHELFVYDDGSEDGTGEWLERAVAAIPVPTRFVRTRFGSPVTAMNQFVAEASAPILAKCDNDAMFPPGWLTASLRVLDQYPGLDLLGIEAMYPHDDDPTVPRAYRPAEFISGLGLYRSRVFARGRPAAFNKYFGLEEWQMAQGPGLIRGWIYPALPVFLLDRFPFDPWRSYSDSYVQRGWQRPWPKYDRASILWRWRWPDGGDCAPAAAQKDTHPLYRLNIGCGDAPQPGFVNVGTFAGPAVEAVDLSRTWPWEDSSVDHVRAWDVVEHLADKIFTMNELWRILKPGATVEICVPTTEGTGAFQDPTHRSYWNRRSFLYYEDDNPYRERHARRYGIQARFRVLREQSEPTPDGPRLIILLQAVKR